LFVNDELKVRFEDFAFGFGKDGAHSSRSFFGGEELDGSFGALSGAAFRSGGINQNAVIRFSKSSGDSDEANADNPMASSGFLSLAIR
jgi:hypothetical protein